MNGTDVDLGPILGRIITVLAYTLVLAIAGLIAIGIFGGDAGVRMTLTHVIETLVGVFVGIAMARLAREPGSEP